MTVPVPVCYRVGWVFEGTGPSARLGESCADEDRSRDSGEVEVPSWPSSGALTWLKDTSSTYRVEWASFPEGPWWTDWESLLGLTATLPTVSAGVPVYYRVVCTGSCSPSMAYIPAGYFKTGDTLGEGDSDELPVHWVHVSAFLMDPTEATNGAVVDVLNWAYGGGEAHRQQHHRQERRG